MTAATDRAARLEGLVRGPLAGLGVRRAPSRSGLSRVCGIGGGPHFGSGLTIDTAAELFENTA